MALQQPLCLYPNGDAVDPALALTFKWQVQGTSSCVAYQELILNLNNTPVYTGTKTTLSTPLYGGEILEINFVATTTLCVAGTTYKHKILMYYNSTEYVTSGEILFYASTTPTLSINMPPNEPHTSKSFDFTLDYVQDEGIEIKYYQYCLYNSSMVQLDTTEKVYSSNTKYIVDGLTSGSTYYIKAMVETQQGIVVMSDLEEFSISYSGMNTPLIATAIYDNNYNALDISWTDAVQYTGVPSSSSGYEYVDDFIYETYNGINILSDQYIEFDVSVPNTFTCHIDFKRLSTFTGDIINLVDESGNTYTLSFNGTNYVYTINDSDLIYSPTTYAGDYFHAILFPTKTMLYGINIGEIYPSDLLYPADDLYMEIKTIPT
jgi:hypothetical protein